MKQAAKTKQLSRKPKMPGHDGRSAANWLRGLDLDAPEAESELAKKAFAAMGAAVVPWLVSEFAKDKLTNARAAKLANAFHALGAQGACAIPALLQSVEKHPQFIPHALAGIGAEAVPALIGLIRHQSLLVRVMAYASLGDAVHYEHLPRTAAAALIPEALEALQHEWHLLRWRAASFLGTLHAQPHVCLPALRRALEDGIPGVQAAAAYALGEYGDDAIEALPRLLELAHADYGPLRCYVIEALGRFSDQRVLPVIIEALQDSEVRTSAISSLGHRLWPPEIVVPVLCGLVANPDSTLRWQASGILGRYEGKASMAIPVLRAAMTDAYESLREVMAKALARIEGTPPRA